MFKDKSKLLLLGALAVLVITLSNGSLFSHGIGFYGFHGFPKILLIAFLVWILCNRGCCGSRNCGSADEADVEAPDESAKSDDDSDEE